MFAPPPVQLSRAEIEARLSARRQSAVVGGPLSPTTSVSSAGRGSLHQTASPTSPYLSRAPSNVTAGVVISPSSSRLEHPKSGVSPPRSDSSIKTTLSDGFAERPRRAPLPPKRSTAPPDEWFTRAKASPLPPPQIPVPATPTELPPPIPAKSPKRQKSRARPGSEILRVLEEDPFNSVGTLGKSNSKRKTKTKDGVTTKTGKVVTPAPDERPSQPVRSWTAPAATMDTGNTSPMKESRIRAASTKTASMDSKELRFLGSSKPSSKLSGVRGARVDKASKRLSSDSSLRAALLDMDELYSFAGPKTPPAKQPDGENKTRSGSLSEIHLPWRRQRKGETMSMLLQSGFFPISSLDGKLNSNFQLDVNVPSSLAFLNKDLPTTPSSIVGTPIELYQQSPPALKSPPGLRSPPGTRHHPARSHQKVGNRGRSPLSQVAVNSAKANSGGISSRGEEVSPGRLSAIPENAPGSENLLPPSGDATPVATQIHLRGGSVVTVSPPELTAWQRSVYIQGPIKLPNPVILPRKNSVASLEPFQDAIDQVYQYALNIPRRRSDEQVVDDVLEFFNDFGFEEIGFVGDVIASEEGQDEEMQETVDMLEGEIERFSTPPAEPDATPVEKSVAKEIVELLSRPPPAAIVRAPKNDLETLRARGIAYLSHRASHPPATPRHVRKDSLKLIPEEPGFAETASGPSLPGYDDADRGLPMARPTLGIDDVEELDGTSSWLGLGIPGLHRSNSKASAKQAQPLAL